MAAACTAALGAYLREAHCKGGDIHLLGSFFLLQL
jgi:hypothetical protein